MSKNYGGLGTPIPLVGCIPLSAIIQYRIGLRGMLFKAQFTLRTIRPCFLLLLSLQRTRQKHLPKSSLTTTMPLPDDIEYPGMASITLNGIVKRTDSAWCGSRVCITVKNTATTIHSSRTRACTSRTLNDKSTSSLSKAANNLVCKGQKREVSQNDKSADCNVREEAARFASKRAGPGLMQRSRMVVAM
jgi:hypothetical protein